MTAKIARTGRVTIDGQGIGFVGKYEQTVPGIGSWYAVTAAGAEAPHTFRTRRDAVAYLEQVERTRVNDEIQAERAAQDAVLAALDAARAAEEAPDTLAADTVQRLEGIARDAETLALEAELEMPREFGALAETEALLSRATQVATETARAVGDFTGPLPEPLAASVLDVAHRMMRAANTIRDAAPMDSALNAVYHAAYTLIYQAAQPVYQAAA